VTHGGQPVVEPLVVAFVSKKDDGRSAAGFCSSQFMHPPPPLGEWEAPDVPVLVQQQTQQQEDFGEQGSK
jgi:hypothetical protein